MPSTFSSFRRPSRNRTIGVLGTAAAAALALGTAGVASGDGGAPGELAAGSAPLTVSSLAAPAPESVSLVGSAERLGTPVAAPGTAELSTADRADGNAAAKADAKAAAEKAQAEKAQEKARAEARAERAAASTAAARSAQRASVTTVAAQTTAQYSGTPQQIARQMVPNDTQFQCFSNIVSHESSWRVTATNPSSGAYGLVQSLPAEKMASAGPDWRTNPVTQLKWGLNYMNERYGSPCEAWTFWQANNWY
ncbi:hypothetical protein GCM10010406_13640 [Streptomyces thermolineatus]|uniref:Transglycosylase SLT domain-containing protein n=1 Tax=Streptomyces thermolineatus TaxID=44033 RepID=A0ABN3L772_9ACTN